MYIVEVVYIKKLYNGIVPTSVVLPFLKLHKPNEIECAFEIIRAFLSVVLILIMKWSNTD